MNFKEAIRLAHLGNFLERGLRVDIISSAKKHKDCQIVVWIDIMLLDFGSMRLHICGKGNLFMVEVISGPNVLWQLYRPPGITRAFRQKGHTGHWEHKTLGHFMCPQTKRLGCYLLSTRRKDFLFVHHPILRKRGISLK